MSRLQPFEYLPKDMQICYENAIQRPKIDMSITAYAAYPNHFLWDCVVTIYVIILIQESYAETAMQRYNNKGKGK